MNESNSLVTKVCCLFFFFFFPPTVSLFPIDVYLYCCLNWFWTLTLWCFPNLRPAKWKTVSLNPRRKQIRWDRVFRSHCATKLKGKVFGWAPGQLWLLRWSWLRAYQTVRAGRHSDGVVWERLPTCVWAGREKKNSAKPWHFFCNSK